MQVSPSYFCSLVAKFLSARCSFESIGGIQSNSMLAISKITTQHFGSKFTYFTKAIPKFLKKNPSGNYAEALKLGTQVTLSSKEVSLTLTCAYCK